MAIGNAVEKSGAVTVYNEKGIFLFSKSGALHGFTGTTVSVKSGGSINTYDEKGNFKFSKSAT
jgi:hypothetical protein